MKKLKEIARARERERMTSKQIEFRVGHNAVQKWAKICAFNFNRIIIQIRKNVGTGWAPARTRGFQKA